MLTFVTFSPSFTTSVCSAQTHLHFEFICRRQFGSRVGETVGLVLCLPSLKETGVFIFVLHAPGVTEGGSDPRGSRSSDGLLQGAELTASAGWCDTSVLPTRKKAI